jgi:hypothetical protein
MKSHEFAKKLLNLPNQELMILDGFNGGGCPREINLGPMEHKVSNFDVLECDDSVNFIGKNILVIGYGCY